MLNLSASSHWTESRRIYHEVLTTVTADRDLLPDRELTADRNTGASSPELVRVYDRYYWAAHSLKPRSWLKWTFVFNLLLIIFDTMMDPSLLVPSLIMRGGLASAILCSVYMVWGRQRQRWVQGATLTVVTVTIMLLAGSLGALGGHGVFERYLTGGLFTIATAILFFPIEFRWTVLGVLAAVTLHIGLLSLGPVEEPMLALMTGVFYCAAMLTFATTRKAVLRRQWNGFKSRIRELRDQAELNRLYAELQLVANLDPLTGIQNRRATQDYIDRIWTDGTYPKSAIAFLMIDIDNFKQLNDTRGHTAGDACIKAVADEIRDALRDSDIVSRHGGEEFLVVLTATSGSHAYAVAERIRKAVECLRIANPGTATATRVTISIGLALWDGETTAQPLIKRADDALYQAKNAGKNRTAISFSQDGPASPEPKAGSAAQESAKAKPRNAA